MEKPKSQNLYCLRNVCTFGSIKTKNKLIFKFVENQILVVDWSLPEAQYVGSQPA